MWAERGQVELLLGGRWARAGSSAPTVPMLQLAAMARALTDRCGLPWCAAPEDLAAAAGLEVIDADMPDGVSVFCDGIRVVVVAACDARERGLLVLRGVAQHALAVEVGRHELADVILLAAELAAPADLVARRGVTAAIARGHVPVWFLRAWERGVMGAPSSESFAP